MSRQLLFSLCDPKAQFKGQWLFVEEEGGFAARLQHPRDGSNPLYLRDRRAFPGYSDLMSFADGLISTGWVITAANDKATTNDTHRPSVPLKPRPSYPPLKAYR
ncbi:MAG: hypothetical protein VKK98_01190 [Cyanobacteriota bacterium]|nr:hypothetical protein [Cyanobacteriota bacterium]